jgi:hypothetical protein
MADIVISVPLSSLTDGNRVVERARAAATTQAAAQGLVLTGAYTHRRVNGNLELVFLAIAAPSSGGGTGTIGPMGPQGPQGAQGPAGLKGDKGDAGATGPQGERGQAGIQGPQGDAGPTGQAGATGGTGPQGAKGDTGSAGSPGTPGSTGPKGDKGDTGSQGQTGQQGQQGPQGLQGVPGPIGGSNDIVRTLAADATGANGNAAQPIFVGATAITLAASAAYEFDLVAHITRAAGTTSHTTGISFGGTATLQAVGGVEYMALIANPTGNVLGPFSGIRGETAANLVLTAANTVATENLRIIVTGLIRTNAGGTLIPQFQYSAAPGGAPTIRRNSYIRLRPLGAATFTAQN